MKDSIQGRIRTFLASEEGKVGGGGVPCPAGQVCDLGTCRDA